MDRVGLRNHNADRRDWPGQYRRRGRLYLGVGNDLGSGSRMPAMYLRRLRSSVGDVAADYPAAGGVSQVPVSRVERRQACRPTADRSRGHAKT